MRANVENFKGQKYEIDRNYSSFEVYANNQVIPVGSNSVLGGYVTEQIPACMTHTFLIRTRTIVNNDVVIEWGDGTKQNLRDNYVGRLMYDEEFNYLVSHTYAQPGKYIVRLWGKDYFSFCQNLLDFSSNSNTENLLCRIFDKDLPIANHVTNMSSGAYNSPRLLNVRIPMYVGLNKIINFANCFKNCRNLKTAYGFNREFYNMYAVTAMFSDCVNMVDCDMVLPPIMGYYNGYAKTFYNCTSLSTDIAHFFPTQGFLGEEITFSQVFRNCSSLTGTIPEVLWHRYNQKWLFTTNTFKGCSEEIASQAPTSWGGTNTSIVIETPVSKQDVDAQLDEYSEQISNAIQQVEEVKDLIVYSLNTVLHSSSMPTASVDYLDKIYLYTGSSNQNFLNGHFYTCKLVDGTYQWRELLIYEVVGTVTDLVGYRIGNQVYMRWTDPEDNTSAPHNTVRWEKTVVVRKSGSYPQHLTDGTQICVQTTRNSYKNTPLELSADDNYYYNVFTVSEYGGVNSSEATKIHPTELTWARLNQILDDERYDLRDYFSNGDTISVEGSNMKSGNTVDFQIVGLSRKKMTLLHYNDSNYKRQYMNSSEKIIAPTTDTKYKPWNYCFYASGTGTSIPSGTLFFKSYDVDKQMTVWRDTSFRYILFFNSQGTVLVDLLETVSREVPAIGTTFNPYKYSVSEYPDNRAYIYQDSLRDMDDLTYNETPLVYAKASQEVFQFCPYFKTTQPSESPIYTTPYDELYTEGQTYYRIDYNWQTDEADFSDSTAVYYELNPYISGGTNTNTTGNLIVTTNRYIGSQLDHFWNPSNSHVWFRDVNYNSNASISTVLDADFQSCLLDTKVEITPSLYPNDKSFITRKFFLPSFYELGRKALKTGTNPTYNLYSLGNTFPFYQNNGIDASNSRRIKYNKAGTAIRYWTRDKVFGSIDNGTVIIANGNINVRKVDVMSGTTISYTCIACNIGRAFDISNGRVIIEDNSNSNVTLTAAQKQILSNCPGFTVQFELQANLGVVDERQMVFSVGPFPQGEREQEYAFEFQRAADWDEFGGDCLLETNDSSCDSQGFKAFDGIKRIITITANSNSIKFYANENEVSFSGSQGRGFYSNVSLENVYRNPSYVKNIKIWNYVLTEGEIQNSLL